MMYVFGAMPFGGVIMFFVSFYKNKKALADKNAIIQGTIIGVLLATSYTAQTIGLKYTSSGHSAFITSSAVIMVPFLLFVLYKQRIKTMSIIAFFVVFVGLFFLTYDFQTKINIGDAITIITAVSYAFHIILSGRFVKKTDVSALVFYQFLAAFLVSLVGYLITNDAPLVLSVKSTLSILYLSLIGTLFCYFATVWVLKYVNVLKLSIIFSLEPVFAAFFAYLAAGELLNFREIAGALFILAGILLYQLIPAFQKTE